jgi:hypothetical protein
MCYLTVSNNDMFCIRQFAVVRFVVRFVVGLLVA